jgi:uncharacterized membrane protein
MTVKDLVRGAIIAALYALLTIFLAPISSGLVQCRVSEALCILPYFTFAAVPGLFVGCLAANLLTGAAIYDVVFGSLATLLAAYTTYLIRSRVSKYLAPMPPVIFNGIIVGALLVYVYGVPVTYPVAAAYVAVGELIACYALGLPLLLVLERFKEKLF